MAPAVALHFGCGCTCHWGRALPREAFTLVWVALHHQRWFTTFRDAFHSALHDTDISCLGLQAIQCSPTTGVGSQGLESWLPVSQSRLVQSLKPEAAGASQTASAADPGMRGLGPQRTPPGELNRWVSGQRLAALGLTWGSATPGPCSIGLVHPMAHVIAGLKPIHSCSPAAIMRCSGDMPAPVRWESTSTTASCPGMGRVSHPSDPCTTVPQVFPGSTGSCFK